MTDTPTKVTAKVVDFTNVKDAGGSFNKRRVPSGDYLAKIVKVQDSPAKNDDTFQYLFTIKLEKHSQYAYPYYCKLVENQLWKLRNLLIAAGINVPKKRVKLDPSKVVGKYIGVSMEDDEYEGKLQSSVSAVFPASELGDGGYAQSSDDDVSDEEESDEADVDSDEEEEVDDEGANRFASMTRNELKVFIKGKNPSFRFLKSQTDDDLRDSALDLDTDSSDGDSDDELEELDIDDL